MSIPRDSHLRVQIGESGSVSGRSRDDKPGINHEAPRDQQPAKWDHHIEEKLPVYTSSNFPKLASKATIPPPKSSRRFPKVQVPPQTFSVGETEGHTRSNTQILISPSISRCATGARYYPKALRIMVAFISIRINSFLSPWSRPCSKETAHRV